MNTLYLYLSTFLEYLTSTLTMCQKCKPVYASQKHRLIIRHVTYDYK